MTKKLALQNSALKAYYNYDYDPSHLTDDGVEVDGDLDGDTLALFIWREIGEAEGNRDEAARMMRVAVAELTRVAEAL